MYGKGKYLIYKEHMNLREKPKTDAKILGAVLINSLIDAEEISDNWARITYNGINGWVCISECFARYVPSCKNTECNYYKLFRETENKYNALLEIL